jgi:pyroglutamyl-peptidase
MANARTTVLLTGFGPFPGVTANASGLLVERLAELAPRVFPGLVVRVEVLPTEWLRAPSRVATLLDRDEPDIALHFGVSSKARGFEIETVGRNRCAEVPDAAGVPPPNLFIARNGHAELMATVPVPEIVRRLRQLGLEAFASRDAGTYLCNAVLYHSLACSRHGTSMLRRGFVHIPEALVRMPMAPGRRARGRSRLDWDGAIVGGIEIIATTLGKRSPWRQVG